MCRICAHMLNFVWLVVVPHGYFKEDVMSLDDLKVL